MFYFAALGLLDRHHAFTGRHRTQRKKQRKNTAKHNNKTKAHIEKLACVHKEQKGQKEQGEGARVDYFAVVRCAFESANIDCSVNASANTSSISSKAHDEVGRFCNPYSNACGVCMCVCMCVCVCTYIHNTLY